MRVRGGDARVFVGFVPEENDDPRTEKRKEMDRKKRAERRRKAGEEEGEERWWWAGGGDEEDEEMEDREAELDERLASRVVIHEPLTRVTTIEWNPNLQCSTWAACAMASGLLRVMDLGVE
ncbi:hypothetical protein N0V88_003234 [Collariella sp. IMI 366227]|nr:hypothetical protein N0V88_003234 [Collariella sp. IMI 366227]